MKTYRKHNCSRRHKSYRTLANCMWPYAAWVMGEGEFALLARCRDLTVTLHPTLESAEQSKRNIDATGCGGGCHKDHEIVRLAAPAEVEAWD